MKTLSTICAVAAVALAAREGDLIGETNATGKLGKSPDAARVIGRLKEWTGAIVHRDIAAIQRIEADDFTFISFQGKLFTKADDVADLKSGDWNITALELDEIQADVSGSLAAVISRATRRGMLNGKDVSGQFRWLDVLVKRRGTWQLLIHQGTKISP